MTDHDDATVDALVVPGVELLPPADPKRDAQDAIAAQVVEAHGTGVNLVGPDGLR